MTTANLLALLCIPDSAVAGQPREDHSVGDAVARNAIAASKGQATSLSAYTTIAAGSAHTCALTTSGGAECWGYNLFGQLGNGTTTDRTTPVEVSGLSSGVAAIAAGSHHTCALVTSGGVKCWGHNGSGQLGDGTFTNRITPLDVSGLSGGVTAIAAGYYHTCALTASGGAKCWGYNEYGQLGNGNVGDSYTPVAVVTSILCLPLSLKAP